MKVDYHVHLEEGPYSLRWWARTAQAMITLDNPYPQKHTSEWIRKLSKAMNDRLQHGAFSENWLELYKRKAKELGLKEVGIVDHLYRFGQCKDYYERYINLADNDLGNLQKTWYEQVCSTSLEDYVTFIDSQKNSWKKDGIELKLGIEADYFSGGEKQLAQILEPFPWDFVIGSVHFVEGWGFDNPDTQNRFHQYQPEDLYAHFFHLVEQAADSGLFDILAHLDNLKVFGFRIDESALVPHYTRVAKALQRSGTATEINSGLKYRYPVKEACPSPSFLHLLKEYDIPITTSSDAHFPDDLGSYLEQSHTLLQKVGYRKIATFDKRKRKETPLL